jgi:hypothetical protein
LKRGGVDKLGQCYNIFMSESEISKLPKGHSLRNKVAKQLREIRSIEKSLNVPYSDYYSTNRNAEDYVRLLSGVRNFFSYVRDLGESNIVLDIGAGEMTAINQFSRSSLGKGLHFEATILTQPKKESNLKMVKSHQVPVETLRGISDRSVGGIIGVLSIAYSSRPILAITSIDRVLVPGGIIKAAFRNMDTSGKRGYAGIRKSSDFKDGFQELGYDVAVDKWNGQNGRYESVLLAIKPGGKASVKAEKLLQADGESADQQITSLWSEGFSYGKPFD